MSIFVLIAFYAYLKYYSYLIRRYCTCLIPQEVSLLQILLKVAIYFIYFHFNFVLIRLDSALNGICEPYSLFDHQV